MAQKSRIAPIHGFGSPADVSAGQEEDKIFSTSGIDWEVLTMYWNKRTQAAKIGYLIISVLLCLLGIALIAVPDFSAALLCKLMGVLMLLFGLIKITGYCAKDLYRLAFQFDLAFGILLMALGGHSDRPDKCDAQHYLQHSGNLCFGGRSVKDPNLH